MLRTASFLCRAALPVLLGFAAASDARAALIFDNTSPGNGGITTTGLAQIGDSVTAASGVPLTVTELDIGLTSQATPQTASLQAFLYANDGTNGAPGTLLWSSAVMNNLSINSNNALIAFSVPSIVVPTSFTFTAALSNTSGVVGFVPAGGASTGTFNAAYAGSPGAFTALSPVFEIEGRVVSAVAVPEPSAIALTGLGLLASGGLAAWRKRRAAVEA